MRRLWGIRHIRWFWLSWKFSRHIEFCQRTGLGYFAQQSDIEFLAGVWAGERDVPSPTMSLAMRIAINSTRMAQANAMRNGDDELTDRIEVVLLGLLRLSVDAESIESLKRKW